MSWWVVDRTRGEVLETRGLFAVGTRLNEVAGWVLLGLLAFGCMLVMRPFFFSLLWAVILVFSTWPLYERLKKLLGGRGLIAAMLMTVVLAAMLIVPMAVLAGALADSADQLVQRLRGQFAQGIPPDWNAPPDWLVALPLIGNALGDLWHGLLTNTGDFLGFLIPYLAPVRDALIRGGLGIGRSLLELVVSVIVAFFLYRDGSYAAAMLHRSIGRVAGEQSRQLIEVAARTIKSVVYGVMGNATIQAILIFVGFWIAGVPEPFLLATLVFIFGLFPVAGPALVWVPVALWLFMTGQLIAGVAIALYGALIVGAVENFFVPYVISRGNKMPFLLVFFGVIGGVLTFGILGIFLGPTLLALGMALIREWLQMQAEDAPRAKAPN